MTRLERAEELLLEARDSGSLPMYSYVAWHEDWTMAIRAFLDEPQGEPEYVWRVTSRRPAVNFGTHVISDFDENYVQEFAKTEIRQYGKKKVTIERAQIGPWEVVE